MQRRLFFAVLLMIVCLTLASHIWIIPFLYYPLLSGVIVHTAEVGDSLRGATDAHGGTLFEERLGFAEELLTNPGAYSLLAVAIGRLRRQTGNSK